MKMIKKVRQVGDPVFDNLKSVLKLSENEVKGIISSGKKYFLKTKNNPSGHYGGYSKYFENLSRVRYKEGPDDSSEGGGGPRALNFNIKHILTAEKILSHQRPLRILDLGCSSGFLRRVLEANVFSPQDIYYYGIDIREHILKKAVLDLGYIEGGAQGDNIPSLYLNYDLRSGLPFQDETFDFVVSFEAIKYLKKNEARKLFKEISRVLKKGKTFIYSTAGIFENERTKEEILKFKDPGFYLWDFTDLKKSFKNSNLFLMKTYGSEIHYRVWRNHVRPEDEPLLLRMEKLYPQELMAAVLVPFYPEATPTKLFFLSKGKISLLEEARKMFPGNKVTPMRHRGNAEIFVIGGKIMKYLPKPYFEKYLKVYKILREQTEIELPELIKIAESEISENYILVMKKVKGDTLGDIWESLSDEKKEFVLRQIVFIMKQIHSVHLNFESAPSYFKLVDGVSDWKRTIKEFCLLRLRKAKENNIIGEDLYKFFLLILKQNIDYLVPSKWNLIHFDLNLQNIMVDKYLKPVILFDFESFHIGDKYLDLVNTSAFFEKKDQETLFNLYGVPDNFEKIAKIYRLILFMRFLQIKKIVKVKQKEIKEFVGGKGPFLSDSFFRHE